MANIITPTSDGYETAPIEVIAKDLHWQRYLFAGALFIGAAVIYKKYTNGTRKSRRKK